MSEDDAASTYRTFVDIYYDAQDGFNALDIAEPSFAEFSGLVATVCGLLQSISSGLHTLVDGTLAVTPVSSSHYLFSSIFSLNVGYHRKTIIRLSRLRQRQSFRKQILLSPNIVNRICITSKTKAGLLVSADKNNWKYTRLVSC